MLRQQALDLVDRAAACSLLVTGAATTDNLPVACVQQGGRKGQAPQTLTERMAGQGPTEARLTSLEIRPSKAWHYSSCRPFIPFHTVNMSLGSGTGQGVLAKGLQGKARQGVPSLHTLDFRSHRLRRLVYDHEEALQLPHVYYQAR